jgi:hypothetical protein
VVVYIGYNADDEVIGQVNVYGYLLYSAVFKHDKKYGVVEHSYGLSYLGVKYNIFLIAKGIVNK